MKVLLKSILIQLLTATLLFGADVQHAQAVQPAGDGRKAQLAALLRPLVGPNDAVIAAAPDGTILAALNADSLLVPASTLKVLTSLAALHHLGPSYRFPTDFFISPAGDLKIKGYGYPLLVSEELTAIALELQKQLQQVGKLVLDDSYFDRPIVIPGRSTSLEPYDAPNGALCVNFNTVFFERHQGQWVSAEPQTPLLPSVIPKIRASGLKNGRITLAGSSDEGILYAGELFRHFLTTAGTAVEGGILRGVVDPQRDTLLLRHLSANALTDVIADLLEFSNNFIANQLMLSMGAEVHGPPATVEKGLSVLQSYYDTIAGAGKGHIAEASGISRQNRISARSMLALLDAFAPYHQLMRRQETRWYKTGTLNGIRTQVGYIQSRTGGLYRFVVMINTRGKSTDPIIRMLEKVLN